MTALDLHYLGHAMWLVEVAGLRLLFDPLLEDSHHGGVFEVHPRREVDVAALRPDFLLVSHRHPDHFDVPSLTRLAALDPDTVVLTADALVERTARRAGFRVARRVDALARVRLEGVELFTTPSRGAVDEWGVMIASDEGVVWNQVDGVHRSPADVRATLERAAAVLTRGGLGGGGASGRLALALARWHPLLEINAATCGAIGFPRAEYAALLDQIAATRAAAIVPAAAGTRHAGAFASMNACVYPVPEARVLRDLRVRCPESHVLPPRVGAIYRVRGGETSIEPGGARALARASAEQPADPRFRPHTLAPVRDANLDGVPTSHLREAVARWVDSALAPALAPVGPPVRAGERPWSLVLEVVYEDVDEAYTIQVANGRAAVTRAFDPDYDLLNTIAGSLLVDVIEGRRHWGEPLLGGLLRACDRGYRMTATGPRPLPFGVVFLYHALSYERSQERAVEWMLGRAR